jgi:hypothetical protein
MLHRLAPGERKDSDDFHRMATQVTYFLQSETAESTTGSLNNAPLCEKQPHLSCRLSPAAFFACAVSRSYGYRRRTGDVRLHHRCASRDNHIPGWDLTKPGTATPPQHRAPGETPLGTPIQGSGLNPLHCYHSNGLILSLLRKNPRSGGCGVRSMDSICPLDEPVPPPKAALFARDPLPVA